MPHPKAVKKAKTAKKIELEEDLEKTKKELEKQLKKIKETLKDVRVLEYHWIVMAPSGAKTWPVPVSHEMTYEKAVIWFRRMRAAKLLSPGIYRMAAWASKEQTIE